MKRGFVFDYNLDLCGFDARLFNDYVPTAVAIRTIVVKPQWYRWRRVTGTNSAWDHYRNMVLQDQHQS